MEEWDELKPKMIFEKTDIHSEEEMKKFIIEEVQGKAFDLVNLPPFRVWLVANYKPNESLIILNGHHSLTDGVQLFGMMHTLDSKADFSRLPRVTPPTFLQMVAMHLASPFAVAREIVKVTLLPM